MSLLKKLQDTGSLKAFWDFRTGSLKDWSGNGYNCTVTGSPRWEYTPKGNAIAIRDGNSYVSPGNPAGLQFAQQFTIIAACTPQLAITYRAIVSKPLATVLYLSNGKAFAWDYASGNRFGGVIPLRFGDPCMLVLTVNNGVTKGSSIYANGMLDTISTITYSNNGYSWKIGQNVGSEFANGPIHFAAITNSILNSQTIAALYNEWLNEPFALDAPKTHYSFPYKTLSPAQATTQGLVLDTDFVRSSDGKVRNFAPTSYTGTLVGNPVPAGDGKGMTFDGVDDCIDFGDVTQMNSASKLTVSGWFKQQANNAGYVLWSKSNFGNNRIGILEYSAADPTGLYLLAQSNTGLAAWGITTTGYIKTGVWQHIVYVFDGAGSTNEEKLKGYIDGNQITGLSYTSTIGNTLPNSPTIPLRVATEALVAGRYANESVKSFRIRTIAMTSAQVRAEYLEGAKELLVDGRLRSDGSCPIGLTAITTVNTKVPGTIWQTNATAPSAVKVLENTSGERYLIGAARFAARQSEAFGSWYFDVEYGAVNVCMVFIAPSADDWTNGYRIYVAGSGLVLYKFVGGVATVLINVNDTTYAGTRFGVWVSRTNAGVFNVYMNKGAGWVLGGTATDTTHVTSSFAGYPTDATNKLYNFMHFAGAMTPAEAIGLGLIQP